MRIIAKEASFAILLTISNIFPKSFEIAPNENNTKKHIKNKQKIMSTSKKHYSAPEAIVVELAVEQGFSLSMSGAEIGDDVDNKISSMDKWTEWDD